MSSSYNKLNGKVIDFKFTLNVISIIANKMLSRVFGTLEHNKPSQPSRNLSTKPQGT